MWTVTAWNELVVNYHIFWMRTITRNFSIDVTIG